MNRFIVTCTNNQKRIKEYFMKKILIGMLVLNSLNALASSSALVCQTENSVNKVELYNISHAKHREGLTFNDLAKEDELLKQVIERIEAKAPVLAQMFAKIYLDVSSIDNVNLGKFAFPPSQIDQVFRICDDDAALPKYVQVSKQEKSLNIDEFLYEKMNSLNQLGLILNEAFKRLNNTGYKTTILDSEKIQSLVSYLLAENGSAKASSLIVRLDEALVKKPITDEITRFRNSFFNARSYEEHKRIKSQAAITLKLSHGVEVAIDGRKHIGGSYQLNRMSEDLPYDLEVIVYAPVYSVAGTMFVGGVGGAIVYILSGGALSLVAPAVLPVAALAGLSFSAYALIANVTHYRKVNLLQEAHDMAEWRQVGEFPILEKFYKKFKRKMKDVSLLEYAQRIVELAERNEFAKSNRRFVNAHNMNRMVLKSFKINK
jgi:hypothetical protein